MYQSIFGYSTSSRLCYLMEDRQWIWAKWQMPPFISQNQPLILYFCSAFWSNHEESVSTDSLGFASYSALQTQLELLFCVICIFSLFQFSAYSVCTQICAVSIGSTFRCRVLNSAHHTVHNETVLEQATVSPSTSEACRRRDDMRMTWKY